MLWICSIANVYLAECQAQLHEHDTHVRNKLLLGIEEDVKLPGVQRFGVDAGNIRPDLHCCGHSRVSKRLRQTIMPLQHVLHRVDRVMPPTRPGSVMSLRKKVT